MATGNDGAITMPWAIPRNKTSSAMSKRNNSWGGAIRKEAKGWGKAATGQTSGWLDTLLGTSSGSSSRKKRGGRKCRR